MKIVILGGSAAGVKMIEEIRQSDSSSEITIISFDGHYPYKRDFFAAFIGKEISPEEVFYRPKDFYEKNKVNILFDQKISRINFKRKKIFIEGKDQIDYDILVITDTPENRFPDIKGSNKENIFGYKKLKDIDTIVNALPVIKTIVIQSDTFSGLQAAAAFVKRGKEVIFVSSENGFLARHFDEEAAKYVVAQFEARGLRIMQGNPISEILGDKEAKAVRLKSGKVFASEAVLFMETDEDWRAFPISGDQIVQKMEADPDFKVKAEGVDGLFAVDQLCYWVDREPVTSLVALEEEGRKVAAAIMGQERSLVLPLSLRSLFIEGIVLTVIGQVQEGEGVELNQVFIPESGQYKRFYVEKGCLVGAVLLNAEDEKGEILRQINEKTIFQRASGEAQVSEDLGESEFCAEEVLAENVSTELIDN